MKRETTFINDGTVSTCTVTRTCKKRGSDPVGTEVSWTFDMKSFKHSEILQHAIRSLVIDAQRLWRDGKIANECTLTKESFITERKSSQPSAKSAKGYVANELAKGRNINDIWDELHGRVD